MRTGLSNTRLLLQSGALGGWVGAGASLALVFGPLGGGRPGGEEVAAAGPGVCGNDTRPGVAASNGSVNRTPDQGSGRHQGC